MHFWWAFLINKDFAVPPRKQAWLWSPLVVFLFLFSWCFHFLQYSGSFGLFYWTLVSFHGNLVPTKGMSQRDYKLVPSRVHDCQSPIYIDGSRAVYLILLSECCMATSFFWRINWELLFFFKFLSRSGELWLKHKSYLLCGFIGRFLTGLCLYILLWHQDSLIFVLSGYCLVSGKLSNVTTYFSYNSNKPQMKLPEKK